MLVGLGPGVRVMVGNWVGVGMVGVGNRTSVCSILVGRGAVAVGVGEGVSQPVNRLKIIEKNIPIRRARLAQDIFGVTINVSIMMNYSIIVWRAIRRQHARFNDTSNAEDH